MYWGDHGAPPDLPTMAKLAPPARSILKSWLSWFGVIVMQAALILAAWLYLVVTGRAHDAPMADWAYPYQCCGGKDCGPIDQKRIVNLDDGYLIDSKFYVKHKDAWGSQDGRFHGCFPKPDELRCLFAPPRGM